MRGRRAPVRPQQATRLATSLSEQGESVRRQGRTLALFDGDGREVADVELAAGGSTKVRHGLKRRPRGWLLCSLRCSDAAATNVTPFETARDTDAITLQSTCSADVTFSVYVY